MTITTCSKCRTESDRILGGVNGWPLCPACDPEQRVNRSPALFRADPMDEYKRRAENSAMGLDEYGMEELPWGHPDRDRF